MRKVCLIGGNGFIGTNLQAVLENEFETFSFDKKNIKNSKNFIEGDVTNLATLEEGLNKNFDFLINLAAEHKDNVSPKSLYYDVNVQGSINICNVAKKLNINNIVFLSSVAIYGFSKTPCDEDSEKKTF